MIPSRGHLKMLRNIVIPHDTRFLNMSSDTKLTGTGKQRPIRHDRDPNPMEDVPDQDSANKPCKRKLNLILLTRTILGHMECMQINMNSMQKLCDTSFSR